MSVLGSSSYFNKDSALFAPYGLANGTVAFSTITSVGSITAEFGPNQFIGISPNLNGDEGIVISGLSTQQQLIILTQVDSAGDSVANVINDLFPGGNSYDIIYQYGNPLVEKARIQLANDVGGGNGGIFMEAENGESLTIGDGVVEVADADLVVSTINGIPYPRGPSFLIYNLTPGSTVTTNGLTPVVVATQASSSAGKAYRVTCVYDVTYAGTTALGDYSELQITGTGVSIFSMATSTYSEINQGIAPLIVPGNSKTSTAVFVDADGGGFNVEIIANAPTALFSYTFYSISVETLD